MHDMDRTELLDFVHQRLTDKQFADSLYAVAPDGTRPVLAVLLSDSLKCVFDDVAKLGGAANIVVALPRRPVIVCVTSKEVPDSDAAKFSTVDGNCTFGVFLAQLQDDGGHMAYVISDAEQHQDSGSAELADHLV